jgi:hypothetical protein
MDHNGREERRGITVLAGQTIERLWPKPTRPAPSPEWDPTALSSEEMVELYDLLREPEQYQRRTGLVSYAMLSQQERDRIEELWSRVIGIA